MTRQWLIVLAIAVLLFVFAVTWSRSRVAEGFVSLDVAAAQRQQLQFEGERRYNDFARLQSPSSTLDPDTIQAALQTEVAVPTSKTPSFLSFLTSNLSLGAADDGSGKQGAWVEQTGVINQKIAFCESLGTDCSALSDPRAAECGICLHGGKTAKGTPHRGGMFISSDDQLRKGVGQQTPTIGTCPAANFVTDPTWCATRSNELSCELKSVLTDSDECGVCYGGASAGKNGLVYMGPKGRTFDAWLNVSHPGYHANAQGYGLTVTRADGTFIAGLQTAVSGNALNPQQVLLPGIKEGDQLVISIYGTPVVWAGYLSNQANNRYVGLDIGIQSVTPTGAFEVAGDAYSSMVTNVMNGLDGWSAYQANFPKTVMWYQRQSNVLPPPIMSANYGSAPQNAVDVSYQVKQLAGTGSSPISTLGVNPMNLGVPDPDPSRLKTILATQDVGNVLAFPDNSQVDPTKFAANVTINFTVPATLADPMGPYDMKDCPTGPIITTSTGLGLFGAHSCYKPDGSANLTVGCLTELYTGAGGQTAGTLNPAGPAGTAPLLAAVAKNANKTQAALTIDDITTFLGLQNDIVLYQADQTGTPVSFAAYQAAAQYLLGRTPGNPCDTPTASTGHHSAECLDYLWRTSGILGAEPTLPNNDPTQLPYQFCTPGGTAAPLAHGQPNQANINAANAQGGMSQVRAYYYSIFQRATGAVPVSINDQNVAMQQCMGVNYTPPAPAPYTQCAPEVFQVVPNGGYSTTPDGAQAACAAFGATVATSALVNEAYGFGGEWCSAGWVQDDTQNAYYPMQSLKPECGSGAGVQKFIAAWLPNQAAGTGGSLGNGNPASAMAGVNCYGVKPPQGTPDVQSFNESTSTWNAPMMPKVGMTISFSPAGPILTSSAPGTSTPTIVARHEDFELLVTDPTGAENDGSFKIVPANDGSTSGFVSFESVNFPGYFLRHDNFMLYLIQKPPLGDTSDPNYPNDTSFAIVAPVAANGSRRGFSIQASNFPDHYMTFNGANAQVSMDTGLTYNAVWQLVPTLNGTKNLSS